MLASIFRYLAPPSGPSLYSGISPRLAISLLERYEQTTPTGAGDKKTKKKEERRSRTEAAGLSRRLRDLVAAQDRLNPSASPSSPAIMARPASNVSAVSGQSSASPGPPTPSVSGDRAPKPQQRRSLPSPPQTGDSRAQSAPPPQASPAPASATQPQSQQKPPKKLSRLGRMRMSSKTPKGDKK
jgi:hypothetical protein